MKYYEVGIVTCLKPAPERVHLALGDLIISENESAEVVSKDHLGVELKVVAVIINNKRYTMEEVVRQDIQLIYNALDGWFEDGRDAVLCTPVVAYPEEVV